MLEGNIKLYSFFFSPAAKYQECDMLLEKSDPMLGLLYYFRFCVF